MEYNDLDDDNSENTARVGKDNKKLITDNHNYFADVQESPDQLPQEFVICD